MADTSPSDFHRAFVALHEARNEAGSEFDLRASLLTHLFVEALGWSRTDSERRVSDDSTDLHLYDDGTPPFPVVVCATRRPSHDIDSEDVARLEIDANGVGSERYGVLTNGHDFRLYEYPSADDAIRLVAEFDVVEIATTDEADLSAEQRDRLAKLSRLNRRRFAKLEDAEYFRETYREVSVRHRPETDDEGYELFLDALEVSLEELTAVLQRFFRDYRRRADGSYPRDVLETTFHGWKEWREYAGRPESAGAVFCRETAYVALNRALFVRIVEDKGIADRRRLSSRGMASALERGDDFPFLDALWDTYDSIDRHYPDLSDLGVFDWWWIRADERERFSEAERRKQRELDADLDAALGRVLGRLNRFDFESANRDILGHVYEDYLPKRERKELGEYYTSLEVVRFMLDAVGYEPHDEGIGRKKVLDPACGSGTFLTEVTDRLLQHFLAEFERERVHELRPEEARTVLERIEENVYGIDVNPFAVHVARINLLFQTIDLYDKVTEEDEEYAIDGFEIHVADALAPTPLEETEGRTDAGGETAFDVVVANPPYVRIQNLSGVKETYAARYASATGNFDVYVPFIERGLDWLAEDGQLAYICPNRLLNADYAETVRDLLVAEPITALLDFTDADVFDVPTPYPCIVTIDREESITDNRVRCARFAETRPGVLDEIARLDEWRTPEDEDGFELFTYPQRALEADNADDTLAIWKPMPETERRVFERIETEADRRVGDVMDEVFQGLATSADGVYVGHVLEELGDGLVTFRPTGSDDPSVVEKAILRKVLKGNEIERWKVDWQGLWLVFPYDESGERADLLSRRTLEAEFPETWAFFEEYEEELKGRESGRMRDREDWYGYVYPKNLNKFDPAKIMLGVLRREPSFVPDPDGEYYFVGGGTAGGYGLHVKREYLADEDDLLYFAAILNSKALEFYHKHVSFVFNGKYYSYGRNFLESHPLPEPDAARKREVVQKAKAIEARSQEVAELGYEVSTILNYLPGYDRERTVRDLATSIDLGDDEYRQDPIRTNDSSERGYQVVVKRGHVIDFEDESVRDFVYELLVAQDARLGRAEILNLAVPTADDVRTLMADYESDAARIEALKREAETLQAELDDVILRDVYGLEDDHVEIVDAFLDVW